MVLHIFKVRYLDYYVIDRGDSGTDIDAQEKKDEKDNGDIREEKWHKIYLEKKKERIIIRDPDNAGYKFISLLFRVFLIMVKFFVVMFASIFCFSLVGLCLLLVLSFLFVKTGLVFIGAVFAIISVIMVNLIILNIAYNFIVSKKYKKNRMALLVAISLIMLGVGCGLFMIGITEFDVVINDNNYEKKEVVIPFREDLVIWDWYDVNYIPSDDQDLKIVYSISEFYELDIEEYDNSIHFNTYCNYDNVISVIRKAIGDINDKKIVDYSRVKIDIYTSAENIAKLQDNKDSYYE